MGNATDYHVYDMKLKDRIVGFGLGFLISLVVIFLFFRNFIFSILVGIVVGIVSITPYRRHLIAKRKSKLLMEFKDMLENLSASYSAGENTRGAFEDCLKDLVTLYGEDADIVIENQIIVSGTTNGLIIEDLLQDFADRTELEDIQSFADVFAVANRMGGNIKQIVADTRNVINDKIEMEMEISSMLNSGKNEINILIVMPLVIMLLLGGKGSMSVAENTLVNVIVKIVCLGIFGLAYLLGRKIMNIKV